jgi:hypothetical protein
MRQAHEHHQRQFDVVISFDNAVPHLLSDAEIQQAFASFYRCIKPGGGCLISVRDYDLEERSGVKVVPMTFGKSKGESIWSSRCGSTTMYTTTSRCK